MIRLLIAVSLLVPVATFANNGNRTVRHRTAITGSASRNAPQHRRQATTDLRPAPPAQSPTSRLRIPRRSQHRTVHRQDSARQVGDVKFQLTKNRDWPGTMAQATIRIPNPFPQERTKSPEVDVALEVTRGEGPNAGKLRVRAKHLSYTIAHDGVTIESGPHFVPNGVNYVVGYVTIVGRSVKVGEQFVASVDKIGTPSVRYGTDELSFDAN